MTISLTHADCGGQWVLMDGKAYCEKCRHVQGVTVIAGIPCVSGVAFGQPAEDEA